MPFLKRALAAMAFIAFTVGLSLVALELLIPVFIPKFDPEGTLDFHYTSDGIPLGPRDTTRRQFKNSGDYDVTVRFNEYGLRDDADLAKADENSWFVVGDSYSMGWGVEEGERYSDELEGLLGRPVYNVAIPTDFDGYARLIEYAQRQGATVRRLIVGVCMENDLVDYRATRPEERQRSPRGLARAKVWLLQNSALYMAVTSLIHSHQGLKDAAIRLGVITENIAGMKRNEYSEQVIAASAERLRELVQPFDAVVLVIPSRGLWIGGNEANERRVHREFVAALQQSGLRVVDMKPVFESTGDPLSYHFANDGHWNPAGHRLAAQTLAASISRTAAVPATH